MSKKNYRSGVVGVCLMMSMVVAGCAEQDTASVPEAPEEIQPAASVTWHGTLRGIAETKCMACHSGTGITPDSLDLRDPQRVVKLAPLILASVEARTMPPWQANEGCNDYKDDLSLTEAEIDLFGQWVKEGMVLGNPADYEAPRPQVSETSQGLEGAPSLHLKPSSPYIPDQGVSDDYRCFVVEPGFEGDQFLKGFEVKPDNVSVLHHMLVFAVPGNEETTKRLAELEAEDEQPGYSCFGDSRTDIDTLAVAWAPGAGRTVFPAGTGLRIPAGDRFVIQMHYNLSEGGSGIDQSGVDMWFYPVDEAPEREGEMIFIGNLPFQIPPGVDGRATESCDKVYMVADNYSLAPGDGINEDDLDEESVGLIGSEGCVQQEFYYSLGRKTEIHSIAPHMHLSGTHISIEILPVDISSGQSEVKEGGACLIDTDRWDFDWQRSYWFKEPVAVPERGVVKLTCRYNNTGSDKAINLGEGSGDEMCLGLIYLTDAL